MGVDADSLEGAMLNWSASFDGHDGDVLMTTGSTDQSGNYVFEVMPNSVGPEVGLQMPYWNTYGGNDTMYSLWDPGGETQSVVLTLYSVDGTHSYAIAATLAPGASEMIDVGMLRREGMPDASGSLLPPGVEDGSAMLEPAGAGKPGKNGMIKVPKSGPAEMEVAVSMGIFNAQTAACCTCCTSCCVYTCLAVEDGLGFVGIGQTLAATMTAEDCCGYLEDFTDAATWSDDNGAVLASQGDGAFNALGVGSANLTAEAYLVAGSGTCNGKCRSILAAPTGQATAKPKILVGLDGNSPSKDITSGSENVFAGEEVQLEADTGNTSPSSAAWTITDGVADTDNSGWSPTTGATGAPTAAARSGQTVTVYWTANESVAIGVTVGGEPASATISVAGPTVGSPWNPPLGSWAMCNGLLEFGGCAAGIVFSPTVTAPAGASSNIVWVQVLTSWEFDQTTNGLKSVCTAPSAGLDTGYSYSTSASTADAPSRPLDGSAATDGTTAAGMNLNADMYLLWKPGPPPPSGGALNGAIPVPLGYVAWSASGDATFSGSWSVDTAASTESQGGFTASSAYPTWPKTWDGSGAESYCNGLGGIGGSGGGGGGAGPGLRILAGGSTIALRSLGIASGGGRSK